MIEKKLVFFFNFFVNHVFYLFGLILLKLLVSVVLGIYNGKTMKI